MVRWVLPLLICIFAGRSPAADLDHVEIHGFATQGFLFSSRNNYLTTRSDSGSLQWTDGAVSLTDSISEKLRVGIQLHMYQLGELGGPNIQVDWASGDYRVNDRFGFRAGKIKTVLGLFNDSQDVDALFLWILLPQAIYPIDNKSFFLAHLGGEIYGDISIGRTGGILQYHGYAGHNDLDLNGGYIRTLSSSGVAFSSAPGGKTYGGDLRWEAPFRGFMLGASANVEAIDGSSTTGARLHVAPTVITAEYAQFNRGKWYFAGEHRRLPANALIFAEAQLVGAIPLDSRSWFIMGGYRMTRALQLGSYYSHSVNKVGPTDLPVNHSKDFVISGRYDFNPYFYGKMEGHFLRGTGLGYYADTNPTGLNPSSNMLAAKIGFSF